MSVEPRTFTENEHLAILADRVAIETASLNVSVETLTTAKVELETKLDVAIAEKATADKAAADAAKALEDFKASLEAEKAAVAKKDERLVAVKAAAAHLAPEFFADEARITRIVAMSDDQFAGYVADLTATNVAPAAPVVTEGAPVTTAMAGTQVEAPVVTTDAPKSALQNFLLPALATEGGK